MIRKIFRILLVFLEYNNGVDYYQGMNSIIGALAIHAEESIWFWLFIELLESYNLDDAYTPELKGAQLFVSQIDMMVQSKFKKLHNHLEEMGFRFEMIAINWVIGFFWSFIPLHIVHLFLTKFFKDGWSEFYKVVYKIFKELNNELMQWQDISELLDLFKEVSVIKCKCK